MSDPGDVEDHEGSLTVYSTGCRLPKCRAANSAYQAGLRAALHQRLLEDPSAAPHGTPSTYTNWGCHCNECTAANTAANRRRKKAR